MNSNNNIDPVEIAKFTANAAHWWDKEGEYKPLHEINPLRLSYINQIAGLRSKKVIDIGCGGGILSESMATLGATVTGIDMSAAALAVAKLHLYESGAQVDYILTTAEQIAADHPGQYDVVTCLEMLEHVPDPASVIAACARLVKPGGHVFFSTLNRNPKSYLFAIIGAEYILKLLPRHTHDYKKFIRPSELAAWARAQQLQLMTMTGITYNPLMQTYKLTADISVNYLAHYQRQDENAHT
jgi:2-polyprenyl-6-hydroxyphenyl methylase/3-demethylubiquinone-9 3-methyltransferase